MNKKITIQSIFMKLIIILFYVNFACASDKPTCFKEFSVAYYENGYYFIQKSNEGINKYLFQELSKRSGCKIVEHTAPRARIWEDLKYGRLDFGTNAIINKEREIYAYFSSYATIKNYALIRKELKDKTMEGFLENKNAVFGVIRGYIHASKKLDDFVDKMRQLNRLEESTNQEQLYLKLNKNHIQGIFVPYGSYKRYSNEINGLNKETIMTDWIPEEKFLTSNIMFSKKVFSKSEFNKWDNIIKNMVKDGTLKRIFLKYFTEKEIKKYNLLID
ncbi:substrate-binding periplasmic protein [Fluviispira vulneris]|uniref:substrate-binding periplasmic protein n=1 Tax=Fluviispira vulneris TaxID=2763012 RepID=UPI0016492397|nr:transporter substrate-binding domain-containing protein [Fluviispira vulneris]